MSHKPPYQKLSILVAAYNEEETLAVCLDAIAAAPLPAGLTREIVLVHHTDCGLTKISEDQLRAELERDTGLRPRFAFESFHDPYVDVRQSIRRLQMNPFLPFKDNVRGFVYEVETGNLREVI